MLMVLSEQLREHDLRMRMPLSHRVRDALINLSTAAYEGKHLIAGSRRTFADLQKLGLDPQPSNRFMEASAYIADAQALRSKVPAYIYVQPIGQESYVEIVSTPDVTGQIVFNVPLDHFADSERVGRPWLMGEDLYDVEIYVALGEAYAQVSAYLARLPARECARVCFSTHTPTAFEKVCALVWSFGLASRRGRT